MNLIQTIETCCLVGESPLSADESERVAAAFRVLADPARLRVLSIIASQGPVCVCNLTAPLSLSQPTVSHHLKMLHEAGLLSREKRGTWAYYSLVPGALDRLRDALTPRAPASV